MVSSSRLPPNELRDFGRLNCSQACQMGCSVSVNCDKDLDDPNPAPDLDNDILVLTQHDVDWLSAIAKNVKAIKPRRKS
jgi:hypothetical protein